METSLTVFLRPVTEEGMAFTKLMFYVNYISIEKKKNVRWTPVNSTQVWCDFIQGAVSGLKLRFILVT